MGGYDDIDTSTIVERESILNPKDIDSNIDEAAVNMIVNQV